MRRKEEWCRGFGLRPPTAWPSGLPWSPGFFADGGGASPAVDLWSNMSHYLYCRPINFPGLPNEDPSIDAWGCFRFGHHASAFHDYLGDTYFHPVYYAPKDTLLLERLEPCMEVPGEFVAYPTVCNTFDTSYCMSAAGLFNPVVFSDNGDGVFWQAPWEMPSGYKSPSFSQVSYPTLTTHMLEHQWLQPTKVP